MAKDRVRPRRPQRIYTGPKGREKSTWWTVSVSDAKQPVTINGDVVHALRGFPGVTVGCGLSNVATDKSNIPAFPHPVYFASFNKSTALIVDRLKKNGEPSHAVLYRHNYGHITDRNDDRTLRRLVKEDPSIMQRSFTLSVPRKARPTGTTTGQHGRSTGKNSPREAFVPRGALARAVKAGRISKHVAVQLTRVAQDK